MTFLTLKTQHFERWANLSMRYTEFCVNVNVNKVTLKILTHTNWALKTTSERTYFNVKFQVILHEVRRGPLEKKFVVPKQIKSNTKTKSVSPCLFDFRKRGMRLRTNDEYTHTQTQKLIRIIFGDGSHGRPVDFKRIHAKHCHNTAGFTSGIFFIFYLSKFIRTLFTELLFI